MWATVLVKNVVNYISQNKTNVIVIVICDKHKLNYLGSFWASPKWQTPMGDYTDRHLRPLYLVETGRIHWG